MRAVIAATRGSVALRALWAIQLRVPGALLRARRRPRRRWLDGSATRFDTFRKSRDGIHHRFLATRRYSLLSLRIRGVVIPARPSRREQERGPADGGNPGA